MLKNKLYKSLITMLLVSMTLVSIHAEDAMPPPDQNIADSWTITPKPGMNAEFEQALKTHLEFRANNGDARVWDTYTPFVSDEMGHYVVRTCCIKWSDVDAYLQWQESSKVNENWNANVDQYVASYAHSYHKIDFENSNWESNPDYRFISLSFLKPKRGSDESLNAAIKEISTHAKEGGWPRKWSWSWKIGGEGGLTLASPMVSMSEMKPDQPFSEFLSEKMRSEKKAKAVMKNYSDQLESSSYAVYMHRKDLSMKMKAE